MAVETLTCKHGGHSFERTAVRGPKPHYCPEHQWVKLGRKDPHAPAPEPSEAPLEKARKAKAAQQIKKTTEVEIHVRKVLGSDRVPAELKRKLRYCQEQIETGREGLMLELRRKFLYEAGKLARPGL